LDDFLEIKDRFSLYTRSSIVYRALDFLHQIEIKRDFRYPVWILFSIIKWANLYAIDNPMKNAISDIEFNQLLNLIKDLQYQHLGINFKNTDNVNRSFKIIAYQQFALQENFSDIVLCRQVLLFLRDPCNDKIKTEFKRLSGITIESFLECAYFTQLYINIDILDKPGLYFTGVLGEDYFNFFYKKWGVNKANQFLKLLSAKNSRDFENLHKMTGEVYQLYETGFFITKPLIRFKGQFHIIHRKIFIQTIKHFIYQFLKIHSDNFPSEFGYRLEAYVEFGIKEIGYSYTQEKDLKSKFPKSKICDFLIEEKVLIEVKATELSPRSGVFRSPKIMQSDLRTTIVKAYAQLIEIANRIDSNSSFYGIIITYKEMLLGFGKDTWHEFLKDPITKFCEDNNHNILAMPPENLFFISIEDWDRTVQIIKDRKASLIEVLKNAYQQNIDPDITKRIMLFQQALRKYELKGYNLTYHENLLNELDLNFSIDV